LLVYAAGVMPPPIERLVWADRAGHEEPLDLPPGLYNSPRLSPDGGRLAVVTAERARTDIWIYDIARRVFSPFTPEPGRTFNPVWSPNGKRIAFCRFEERLPQLYWKPADGSALAEPLTPGDGPEFPNSFSPDGRFLAYITTAAGKIANPDIRVLSLEANRQSRAWLETPFRETSVEFSPDGRVLAYTSEESGRNEVYVRPYPGPGGRTPVSSGGGSEPAWSPDGRELFYRSGEQFLAVSVQTSPDFTVSAGRVLFSGNYSRGGRQDFPRDYDVSRDGKRFLLIKPVETKREPIRQLQLVTNWFASLEAGREKP
jgi:serine/threonine-protein kinase